MTHTELSSDTTSIPLLAQLQSAPRPPQLSNVAAPQKGLEAKADRHSRSVDMFNTRPHHSYNLKYRCAENKITDR